MPGLPPRSLLPLPVTSIPTNDQSTGIRHTRQYRTLESDIKKSGYDVVIDLTQLGLQCFQLDFTEHVGTCSDSVLGTKTLRLTRPDAPIAIYAHLQPGPGFFILCIHTEIGEIRILRSLLDLRPFAGWLIRPLLKVLKTCEPDDVEEERIDSIIKFCFAYHGKWNDCALLRISGGKLSYYTRLLRTLLYLRGMRTKDTTTITSPSFATTLTQSDGHSGYISPLRPVRSSGRPESINKDVFRQTHFSMSDDELDPDGERNISSNESDSLEFDPAMLDHTVEHIPYSQTIGSSEQAEAQGPPIESPYSTSDQVHPEQNVEHSYSSGREEPSTAQLEIRATTTELARARTEGDTSSSSGRSELRTRKRTIGDILSESMGGSCRADTGASEHRQHDGTYGAGNSVTQHGSQISGHAPTFSHPGEYGISASSGDRYPKRSRGRAARD